MALLEMTVAPGAWLEVLEAVHAEPNARWRIEGDNGYVSEGRLTHWPPGPPEEWTVDATINVAREAEAAREDAQVGVPLCVGSVRAIRRIP